MEQEYRAGNIEPVSIVDEMRSSYIDYAMSVIASRALPDVRDGLKPVHRRILYAMRDMGLRPDRGHRKSARVVGEVLGKYHPHSDASVYDALVRMAQDFNMRYPLVDGHGNFGSIDGDSAAAMRYTEARLSRIAMEMLTDIDKDTVDFMPNFDDQEREPVVLPARFPNLLVNGASGIAVGMATNIPPHNLAEVIDATMALIDNPNMTSLELMEIVRGPDFPTGGLIVGTEAIKQAYTTGRGVITMRAKAEIVESRGGRQRIVVTEIPYQVNKAKLIEKIADLVRDKRIEGITDLRDESDRSGLRIAIDLSRAANGNVVLNKLYKYTPLQQSFGIILLALVDGEPRVLSLREAVRHYLEHQRDIIVRRSKYELARAEARAHILEGLRIALDHIDAIIALIRASQTVDEARQELMEQFELSEKQAQAILDMRLQRLTGLERDKIEEEYAQLRKEIEYLRAVLASDEMVYEIVRAELADVRDRFGDERRTQITIDVDADIDIEDLIAQRDVVVTLSHQGYIKRMPLSTYRAQRRGGRGITGMNTKEEDFVEQLFTTTTHHYLLFFTSHGKVYRKRAFEIPEASRQARGTAVINLIQIERDERVTAVIPIEEFEEDAYLVMATEGGYVKKTALSEYHTNRQTGLIALSLNDGDELMAVRRTRGDQHITLVTNRGMAIRFPETDVRPMGRTARGVIGVRLDPEDRVIAMAVLEPEDEQGELLLVTENGYGKRTPLEDFRPQGRGGKGLKAVNLTARTGPVVGARKVRPEDELMIISAEGIIIRVEVRGISRQSRYAQGVLIMRLDTGDRVVSVARVVTDDDEAEDEDG